MLYWDQNLSSQTDFLFYVVLCKLHHLKLQFHFCNFLMHFHLFCLLCIQNTMNQNKCHRVGCRFCGFQMSFTSRPIGKAYFGDSFENQPWHTVITSATGTIVHGNDNDPSVKGPSVCHVTNENFSDFGIWICRFVEQLLERYSDLNIIEWKTYDSKSMKVIGPVVPWLDFEIRWKSWIWLFIAWTLIFKFSHFLKKSHFLSKFVVNSPNCVMFGVYFDLP